MERKIKTGPIVRVESLSHRYHTSWVIKNIHFEIERVGVQGLLGSNGAGKSTIMNIICGIFNQTQGEVWIDGINLRENPIGAKRNIGFLPQKPPLYPELTIEEYLVHCADIRLIDKAKIKLAVEEAMERCSITDFRHRLLRNLSGGYQQRVGIAQAIVHNPPLVVLDEPTNGLDPNQIMEVRQLIRNLAQDRAVLVSTHILTEVEAMCDRILMIEQGKMVFQGTMEQFGYCIAPHAFVARFAEEPDPEALKGISGVTFVQKIGERRYKVYFENEQGLTQRVIRQSVAKDWQLVEITLERSSLEEIFANLSGKHN